jgi:hypothetical protein
MPKSFKRLVFLTKQMWYYKNLSIKYRKEGKHDLATAAWRKASEINRALGGNGVV